MNQRQRSIRAGIREAKRSGQPFHMAKVASCTEPKVYDPAKVYAAIVKEQSKHYKDKRKIKHLKSMLVKPMIV